MAECIDEGVERAGLKAAGAGSTSRSVERYRSVRQSSWLEGWSLAEERVVEEELEHAIRAACDVAQDDAVYVFGSHAILGQYPDAPAA